MLVITRKVGERLLIGDGVAVTVIKVAGGGVRLGIEAPPEMAITREELAEQMDAERNEAILPFRAPQADDA